MTNCNETRGRPGQRAMAWVHFGTGEVQANHSATRTGKPSRCTAHNDEIESDAIRHGFHERVQEV